MKDISGCAGCFDICFNLLVYDNRKEIESVSIGETHLCPSQQLVYLAVDTGIVFIGDKQCMQSWSQKTIERRVMQFIEEGHLSNPVLEFDSGGQIYAVAFALIGGNGGYEFVLDENNGEYFASFVHNCPARSRIAPTVYNRGLLGFRVGSA